MTRERAGQLALLAAVVALAAFLRFDGLGRPNYWLDEILGDHLTTRAAAEPLWRWLTGLEREHGPLYYATQLATRVVGRDEGAGRLAAAIFGVLTIPLVWFAGRLSGRRASGFCAAVLLAISPLHVYYSREARPYALLMLLTAALLIALLCAVGRSAAGLHLDARSSRGSAQPRAAEIVILIAMLYTSAVAAPVVAAAAVTALGAGFAARDRDQRRRLWVVSGIAVVVVLLFGALYRGTPPVIAAAGFPRPAFSIAAQLARALSVSALATPEHGRTVIVMVVLAAIGAIAMWREKRDAAVVAIGMTVLPAVFAVASLRFFGHWFSVRYASPALIGFLVLGGHGIASLATAAARAVRKPIAAMVIAATVSVAIIAAIAMQTWSAARTEAYEKLDWRAIAASLEQHARPGDVIVAADSWSDVSLRYYLRALPPGIRVVSVDTPQIATILTRTSPAVWLVSAGIATPTAMRGWTCAYPQLLATRLEDVRVNFAPDVRQFIQKRATPDDLRALAASLGDSLTLRIGSGDDALLGSGWGTAEGSPDTFRWALGTRASLVIPRMSRHDTIVTVHAMPLAFRSLAPQRMQLVVNGRVAGETTMQDGWGDYRFEVPAATWMEGLNDLSFVFARSTEPAALDASSSDRRQLAASFESIEIRDTAVPPPSGVDPRPVITARFASDDLLNAKGVAKRYATRFPPGHLNRGSVEPLLGRLGFDPVATWPRLARGEVHVEDVAATLAYGSDCEDDRSFLQRAFAVMVQRHPNAVEESDLLARLKRGASRAQIVERIARADDFRARMLAR